MDNEDNGTDTIILVPGYQIETNELPKMAKRMAFLAEAYGFEVKAGQSKFFEPAKYFKGTDKKGDLKTEEKTVINNWIDAVNRERKIRFTAVWHDGSFYTGWVGLKLKKSTELNKMIKGEEE